MTDIYFMKIDHDIYDECVSLTVKPEQQSLVKSNKDSLKVYQESPTDIEPLAIYAGEKMVGFLM